MAKQKFSIGAFGMIFDEQKRVLLCHRRDYELWNLPGGGLKAGESPWDACIREVKEETGLDVKIERLVGIYSKPKKNDLVFSFLCEKVGGKLKLNDEADQLEYFAFDNVPRNTVPKQVIRIKHALENKKELYMEVQESSMSIIKMIKKGLL